MYSCFWHSVQCRVRRKNECVLGMHQPRRATKRQGLGCVVPRRDRRVDSRNLASDFFDTSVDDEMTLISVSLHRALLDLRVTRTARAQQSMAVAWHA